MTLNLIGIGADTADLTEYGVSLVLSCQKVLFLEAKYQPYNKTKLEKLLSIRISEISLENFDEKLTSVLDQICTNKETYSLLIPGNPFCENFYPRIENHCKPFNINIKIVHNCSYLNKLGNTGIQLYKFGRKIFVHHLSENIDSYVHVINSNMTRNLNTHLLFDKSDSTLGSQMISKLSELSFEGKIAKANAKWVVLFRDEKNGLQFDSFPINCPNQHQLIETAALCVDWDCIEEEYLRKMKYYVSHTRGKNTANGNFSIIGLGLGKPSDISLKGKKLIEDSDKIFLEGYTSIMLGGKDELQSYFQKDIIVVDRETVEQRSSEILDHLENGVNVSFLVVGDPFGATTHTDIILRSLEKANDIIIANNASIINSIGISGLKPSQFGGIVSIPLWKGTQKPTSFYDKIVENAKVGLHTLCLLDIQVKEQSIENLMKGRKIYEKPMYMSVSVAAEQLLACRDEKLNRQEEEESDLVINENSFVVCLLRIGTDFESVKVHRLGELPSLDFGSPLHSLIIVGEVDEDEKLLIKTEL